MKLSWDRRRLGDVLAGHADDQVLLAAAIEADDMEPATEAVFGLGGLLHRDGPGPPGRRPERQRVPGSRLDMKGKTGHTGFGLDSYSRDWRQ